MAERFVEADVEKLRASSLVSWVVNKVDDWVDHRENNYDKKFKQYYRLYRGIWTKEDQNRKSERSKLISPALQQAVEATVAELEEATFGQKGITWFDLHDDIKDEAKDDMQALRLLLADEMEEMGYAEAISRIFLNGAIFGTGVGKLIPMDKTEPKIGRNPETGEAIVEEVKRFRCKLECINPMEFAIDPSARNVDEALGCAHIIPKPIADVRQKQLEGFYANVELGDWPEGTPMHDFQMNKMDSTLDYEDVVKIVEYHGKVPRGLLPIEAEEDDIEVVSFVPQNEAGEIALEYDEGDMVEVIVTIANDSVLLRANENTTLMKDRAIIAYQHDTVNESFWGRGICEKGFNSQKALDSELRGRIDAMAFHSAPMMAMNATMLPRGRADLSVRPGKMWLTNGNPADTFMPIQFQGGNQATFHQAGDLERMVQMGTGAMDSASPLSQNPRNSTASGMSMMQSAFIKRSKRTMQNIERQFLDPLIKRTAYRYMQFDSTNFPPFDPVFKVSATMGIAAREFESAQLTQMMQIVPPDHPAFGVLMDGLVENTSLSNKTQLKAALEQARQPNPEQQEQVKIQMENMKAEVAKLHAEIQELQTQSVKNLADAKAKGDDTAIKRKQVNRGDNNAKQTN